MIGFVIEQVKACMTKSGRLKARFKSFGRESSLLSPLQIDGPGNISIGNAVRVNSFAWLAALPLTNSGHCELSIRDGAVIGHFCHIYATRRIVIGESALLADRVYISDNSHAYENPRLPVMDQPIVQKPEVRIGDGCWIGENVAIIGASVGKNSVVGANSVVTKDVPDYCVAVGAPARIVKRYNMSTEKWERVAADGENWK